MKFPIIYGKIIHFPNHQPVIILQFDHFIPPFFLLSYHYKVHQGLLVKIPWLRTDSRCDSRPAEGRKGRQRRSDWGSRRWDLDSLRNWSRSPRDHRWETKKLEANSKIVEDLVEDMNIYIYIYFDLVIYYMLILMLILDIDTRKKIQKIWLWMNRTFADPSPFSWFSGNQSFEVDRRADSLLGSSVFWLLIQKIINHRIYPLSPWKPLVTSTNWWV